MVVEVLELLSLAREFYQDSSDMRQFLNPRAGMSLQLELGCHCVVVSAACCSRAAAALARSDEDQLAAEPGGKLVVRLTRR